MNLLYLDISLDRLEWWFFAWLQLYSPIVEIRTVAGDSCTLTVSWCSLFALLAFYWPSFLHVRYQCTLGVATTLMRVFLANSITKVIQVLSRQLEPVDQHKHSAANGSLHALRQWRHLHSSCWHDWSSAVRSLKRNLYNPHHISTPHLHRSDLHLTNHHTHHCSVLWSGLAYRCQWRHNSVRSWSVSRLLQGVVH